MNRSFTALIYCFVRAPGAEKMQFQPFQSYKKTMDFKDNFMTFTMPGEEDDASKVSILNK